MEAFESVLEAMDEKYGALDGPGDGGVAVTFTDGMQEQADIAGIDKSGNADRCYYFTWEEFDDNDVWEIAETSGLTESEVRKEIDVDEPFVMLQGIAPMDNVRNVSLDSGGLF